jgi:RNA polymerase sigma-70 factor (ECF subfamily)
MPSPYADRSSRELLALARDGDSRALSTLFARQGASLRQWAQRRLPKWARDLLDTNDLVQDALLQTFRRLGGFDDRGRGALQAYLREAVRNRIRDEVRKVGRRPVEHAIHDVFEVPGPGPDMRAAEAEFSRRYKEKLNELAE